MELSRAFMSLQYINRKLHLSFQVQSDAVFLHPLVLYLAVGGNTSNDNFLSELQRHLQDFVLGRLGRPTKSFLIFCGRDGQVGSKAIDTVELPEVHG